MLPHLPLCLFRSDPNICLKCTGQANNTISECPHFAIAGDANDMLFEHNNIRHACFGTTDVGAFYAGQRFVRPDALQLTKQACLHSHRVSCRCYSVHWCSWSERGNVVRFNSFDTIRSTERLAQLDSSQNAFYLGESACASEKMVKPRAAFVLVCLNLIDCEPAARRPHEWLRVLWQLHNKRNNRRFDQWGEEEHHIR